MFGAERSDLEGGGCFYFETWVSVMDQGRMNTAG